MEAKTPLRMALIAMSHAYFLEDFHPFTQRADVDWHVIGSGEEWADVDVLFLAGSKDVAADYDELVSQGLDQMIIQHALKGHWVYGICGGLQLMGTRLYDPEHCKYPFLEKSMLGLLQIETVFQKEMIVRRLKAVSAPWGNVIDGFESHRGVSQGDEPVLFRDADAMPLGYGHGKLMGTYLHGCFRSETFVESLIAQVMNDDLDFIDSARIMNL